ncbi:MAG: lipoate protein ligase C-terminal domain-containing protein [Nitrosopumilaceae archaeon]
MIKKANQLNKKSLKMKEVTNIFKSEKLIKVFLSYDEENNVIHSINITGDFFLYPEEGLEILEADLVGTKLKKKLIRERIKESLTNSEAFGFDEESMTQAIMGCLGNELDESKV